MQQKTCFVSIPAKNITKDMKNYLQNKLIYFLMMPSVRIRNNNEWSKVFAGGFFVF